jgi:hypothetical protein
MENLANSLLERYMNTVVAKFVERVPNLLEQNIRIIKLQNKGFISQ